MSNWEKKRNEMQRKIERRSNIIAVVCVMLMCAAVFSCVKMQKTAAEKDIKRDFVLKKEMQKQK